MHHGLRQQVCELESHHADVRSDVQHRACVLRMRNPGYHMFLESAKEKHRQVDTLGQIQLVYNPVDRFFLNAFHSKQANRLVQQMRAHHFVFCCKFHITPR